jgi:uridine kinase
MSKKPYIIGISGGSCSGKSTLADSLKNMLDKKYIVSLLNMDNYYQWSAMKTIAPITRIEYPEHNHPDAVDKEKLYKDFRAAISDKINDIVLIEGVFSLYFDEIREKLDLKVFVDLKSDERLYRRIKRRFESLDDTARRYLDTVRYRHDEFVEPTRWHADIIINGTLDANLGTSIIVSYIEAQISQ